MSRVTLKTIAEKANVSIGTVDRALNERGRINPETKQRILQIAEELGYRTNTLASALKRQQNFRIAVIMPQLPHYFTDELKEGVESIRDELATYYVDIDFIYSDTLSADEQIPLLKSLDFSIYNAVAINAGSNELTPYINRIVKSGIPVATFNTDVPGSRRLFYVGENSYACGRTAGELMGKMLRGEGTVAILFGFSKTHSHKARTLGFCDYLKEHYPKIQIIDPVEYHDQEEEAYVHMRLLLEKNETINGVFCVSAVGAIGAGEYLQTCKNPGEICLIGYDANYNSAKLLRNGYCSALMYQDPRKQSRRAILQLFNLLTGKSEPEQAFYYTKTKIVVCENLSDYMNVHP